MTPNKFQHGGIEWIPHTPGEPMPCPGDTLVRVLYRDKIIAKDFATMVDWCEVGGAINAEVIGWHPIEEQTSLARRVLDLLEAGDIEQAKHELRKKLE